MSQKKMSEHQRERLAQLLDEGATLHAIMRDASFCCSYTVLMRWMEEIGRPADRTRMKTPLAGEAKKEAIRQMIALRQQGVSISALSRYPDWPNHPETIRGWLNAAGFVPDPDCPPTAESVAIIQEMFAKGSSFTDMQTATSTDSTTLSRWLSFLGLSLDVRAVERSLPGGVERLRELRKLGQSVRQIASSYGIQSSIIQRGVDELGLSAPRREKKVAAKKPISVNPAKPPKKIGTMVVKRPEDRPDKPSKSLIERIQERQEKEQQMKRFDPEIAGYKLRIVPAPVLAFPKVGKESFDEIMAIKFNDEEDAKC